MKKILLNQMFATMLVLLMVGCGEENPSKDDIRDLGNTEEDYCSLYGWYGDGTCDSFCKKHDVDCPLCDLVCPAGYEAVDVCSDDADCVEVGCGGVDLTCQRSECAALFQCPEGYSYVDQCAADSDCVQLSGCGETVDCQRDVDCAALPVCQDGYEQVETCPADVSCIQETVCGTTITCQEVALCDPAICPEGMTQVSSCEQASSECIEILSFCGGPTFCERTAACEAFPVCPGGTREVDFCDVSQSHCQLASICGYALYCLEVAECTAVATCQPDEIAHATRAECPAGVPCREESICGTLVYCSPGPACALPVCPLGTEQVTQCGDEEECITVGGCGENIQCKVLLD